MANTAAQQLVGSCLCGGCAFEAEPAVVFFHYCHCSRCRKATGSAHSANLLAKASGFRWTRGEDLVRRYELGAAQHFCTGWCSVCGSAMPWMARNGRYVVIPAGSLDADPVLRPHSSIHWASRAPWYEPVESLPRFEVEPVR